MEKVIEKLEEGTHKADLVDFFELMKPKVMRLVVFTAAVGMLAAQELIHPVIAISSMILIGLGAGASGALNMWWDSDIDALMDRTSQRPIPAGKVKPNDVLFFGVFLSCFSVMLLGLFANFLSAAILAITILFYLVIYSMWLKRSTPQHIVIGGAAGAFPPVIGWAVSTGKIELESILMFLIIFIWTPPHFWALSLFAHSDYSRAKVPMLTVTHGKPHTRMQILLYTVALVIVSFGIAFSKIGGIFYFGVALILNVHFAYLAFRVYRGGENPMVDKGMKYEKKLFLFSILYLFLIFGAILIESIIDKANANFLNFELYKVFI